MVKTKKLGCVLGDDKGYQQRKSLATAVFCALTRLSSKVDERTRVNMPKTLEGLQKNI